MVFNGIKWHPNFGSGHRASTSLFPEPSVSRGALFLCPGHPAAQREVRVGSDLRAPWTAVGRAQAPSARADRRGASRTARSSLQPLPLSMGLRATLWTAYPSRPTFHSPQRLSVQVQPLCGTPGGTVSEAPVQEGGAEGPRGQRQPCPITGAPSWAGLQVWSRGLGCPWSACAG